VKVLVLPSMAFEGMLLEVRPFGQARRCDQRHWSGCRRRSRAPRSGNRDLDIRNDERGASRIDDMYGNGAGGRARARRRVVNPR